jgi:hypothetical protein
MLHPLQVFFGVRAVRPPVTLRMALMKANWVDDRVKEVFMAFNLLERGICVKYTGAEFVIRKPLRHKGLRVSGGQRRLSDADC